MESQSLTLLDHKKDFLEDMLDRLVNWDQSADTAQLVIDQNQQIIEKIIEIDNEITTSDLVDFTKRHKRLIEHVVSLQEQLITVIKKESSILSDQMNQINLSEKVVSHYMDKEKSLFVDRDM